MDPRETKIYTAVVIASILVGIIISYFIISLVRHQRHIVMVSRRNILRETALLDQDRMRVAADLHDEISPVLSAIKFQIDSIETTDADDQDVIDTSKSQLDFLSARLREIAKDLMPVSLTKKGLQATLQEYFEQLKKSAVLNIIFEYDVTASIGDVVLLNVYRIIQEMAHNSVKHSEADTLLVQILQTNDRVKVLCEDNGKGFNYNKKVAEADGLGLNNIRDRAELIGTNFNVHSAIGKGTQYTFDIPLKKYT
jgi:signal transduction histidine kinase